LRGPIGWNTHTFLNDAGATLVALSAFDQPSSPYLWADIRRLRLFVRVPTADIAASDEPFRIRLPAQEASP